MRGTRMDGSTVPQQTKRVAVFQVRDAWWLVMIWSARAVHSAAVVALPELNRSTAVMVGGVSPIAARTGEGLPFPALQAEPVET